MNNFDDLFEQQPQAEAAPQKQETAQIMSGQVKTWDVIEGLTGHWNMPCTFRLARAAAMW